MDDLELEVPWPSPDDDLFAVDAQPWRGIASVGDMRGGTPHFVYPDGYREAAEILVRHVVEDDGYHADYLVYPIMFLYRQYVELRLKEIAVIGARLVDAEPPPAELLHQHRLEPIWKFCRTRVERADNGPYDDLDNAERTLSKLTWADPGSFAFRYPTTKTGDSSLPKSLTSIDLARVGNVMAGVGNLLDAIVSSVTAEQDLKDEWERETSWYE